MNNILNLLAEMERFKISKVQVADLIGVSISTVYNKLTGRTEFTLREAILIKETFFPAMTIEYLFGEGVSNGDHEE